jgi:hypothetical protein
VIKAIIFTSAGEQVILRDSLDEVQNQVDQMSDVLTFRVFQVKGKKKVKKEYNNGTR